MGIFPGAGSGTTDRMRGGRESGFGIISLILTYPQWKVDILRDGAEIRALAMLQEGEAAVNSK